jgi:NTE family protein
MRVALALGGGGARGYAHVGVIEVLQERGFEIVSVSGCSIGALVGGVFAAGEFDAFVEWIRAISYRKVLRLMDPALRGPGMIRAERIMAHVGELLGDQRIEDAPVPFTAVATDLLARRPVWFRRGPLTVAIRASIALPPAITPVVLNGRLLADGGLSDPLPVAATAGSEAEAVIAVSLNGTRRSSQLLEPVRESANPRPGPQERRRRRRRAGGPVQVLPTLRALPAQLAGTTKVRPERGTSHPTVEDSDDVWAFGDLPSGLRTSDVVSLSLETVQEVLTRHQLATCSPDVLIEVPVDSCGPHELHRVNEMIEVGRAAAVQALDRSSLAT